MQENTKELLRRKLVLNFSTAHIGVHSSPSPLPPIHTYTFPQVFCRDPFASKEPTCFEVYSGNRDPGGIMCSKECLSFSTISLQKRVPVQFRHQMKQPLMWRALSIRSMAHRWHNFKRACERVPPSALLKVVWVCVRVSASVPSAPSRAWLLILGEKNFPLHRSSASSECLAPMESLPEKPWTVTALWWRKLRGSPHLEKTRLIQLKVIFPTRWSAFVELTAGLTDYHLLHFYPKCQIQNRSKKPSEVDIRVPWWPSGQGCGDVPRWPWLGPWRGSFLRATGKAKKKKPST